MDDANPSAENKPNDSSGSSTLSVAKAMILSSFLRSVVVVCTVGNFLFQIALLLLVVLAKQQHMSAAVIGLLLATSGACGLAGAIIAPMIGTRVRDERNIIKVCVVAWAALTFVIAISAQPIIGLIAFGGLSVTGGFLNVAITTHQVRRVPGHILGRVVGINNFFTWGAVSVGALSGGYIVAELQPQTTAWMVFGLSMAMIAVAFVLVSPQSCLPDRMVNRLKKLLSAPAAVPFCPPDEIDKERLEPDPRDLLWHTTLTR